MELSLSNGKKKINCCPSHQSYVFILIWGGAIVRWKEFWLLQDLKYQGNIIFFLTLFLLNEVSCLSENTWTPGVLKSRGDRMVTHFSVSFRACININLTCLCTLLDWGLSLCLNAFAELDHEREGLKEDKVPGVFEEENQVSLRT